MIWPQASKVPGSAATTAGTCCPTPAMWTLPELPRRERREEALWRLNTYEGSLSKSQD